jgi:pyrroline-5-carboxylate reductase
LSAARLPPVLLVGGGRMGGAMLRGWQERGLSPSVVLDPAPEAVALEGPGVQVVASADAIPAGFHPAALVLAVKPQVAGAALPAVATFATGGDAVALSIMAGRTLAGLAALLPGVPLVRAMPNTPAAIGRGMTVACAGPGVSEAQRALCGALLAAVGEIAWVGDEDLLDAVTAVSGSGPAYVFLLAELLERAGEEQGLPPALARQLARATVAGSGALLAASAEDAAALRRAVTSPGGTTQAALAVLMGDEGGEAAWPATLSRAVAAAAKRSRELAG